MTTASDLAVLHHRFMSYRKDHPGWGLLHLAVHGHVSDEMLKSVITFSKKKPIDVGLTEPVDPEGPALAAILLQMEVSERQDFVASLPRATTRWEPDE